jgi:hypothetical protein
MVRFMADIFPQRKASDEAKPKYRGGSLVLLSLVAVGMGAGLESYLRARGYYHEKFVRLLSLGRPAEPAGPPAFVAPPAFELNPPTLTLIGAAICALLAITCIALTFTPRGRTIPGQRRGAAVVISLLALYCLIMSRAPLLEVFREVFG